MNRPSLSGVLCHGLVLAAAVAASANAQAPQWQDSTGLKSNTVEFAAASGVFLVLGSGSQATNGLGERLQDPQQRIALRAEQRAAIVENHHGVAEALQLNDVEYQQLIELLTDQQMAQLEEFHLRTSNPAANGGPDIDLSARAERMSKDIEALRELLGPEDLERYQAMRPSLTQRRQVHEFEARLDTPHKLSATQREQLVLLFHDHLMHEISQRRSLMGRSRLPLGTPNAVASQEELQRHSRLMNIESNEELWRRMPQANRELREQAAAFLTARQLEVLERMHGEQATALQQRIEQMRLQAGLSPAIPEQPEDAATTPATVNGDVKLSMRLVVNRSEPKYFTDVVSSGKKVSFQLDEKLSVEATTTLFENDMYELRVAYYETGITGKRLIGNMAEIGLIERASPQGRWQRLQGGSGTVITGNKAYAVQVSSTVEAI